MRAQTKAYTHGASPALLSIPQGQPFLSTLVSAVLSGHFTHGQPPPQLDLPNLTIYLPSRHARDALRHEFVARAVNGATLLPRIRVLGDDDETPDGADGLHTPSQMERRLILTRLILAASSRADDEADENFPQQFTPREAYAAGGTLAALFDEIETEGGDVAVLARMGYERGGAQNLRAQHLLRDVVRGWTQAMRANGWIGSAARRNKLLEREAADLVVALGPVIVAGSTGSIPATLAFMRSVLRLGRGYIVLPGIDRVLDEAGWRSVCDHPEHPQHGMAQLLRKLGLERSGVPDLSASDAQPHHAPRQRFLAEAMRPSSTLDYWPKFLAEARDAPASAIPPVIEADDAHEEAEVAAHLLREALETPGQTAALITPDITLQRRVAVLLARWGIGGRASVERSHAILCSGLAHCIADEDCTAFVFLLKHLTAGGDYAERAVLLEAATVRQSWLPASLAALSSAVARTRAAVSRGELRHPLFVRTGDETWQWVQQFADDAVRALHPLTELADKRAPLNRWIEAHLAALDLLHDVLPAPAFETARGHLGTLREACKRDKPAMRLSLGDYAGLLAATEADAPQPSPGTGHPRLFFWTPLDARLQSADLVVLSGLNEGSWPQTHRPNPWFSLADQAALGLPPPERRLGQAAHDFAMFASFDNAILTRARKSGGAPARPSRWIVRLKTLAAALQPEATNDARPWLAALRQRVRPERVTPQPKPEPRPPVAFRPRRLSVTAIETWLANPYAVYAQYILKLSELRAPGLDAQARERGMLVHRALHNFTQAHPTHLPANTQAALMAQFDAAAAEIGEHPRLVAFWRPRFERFAAWFAETEPQRRSGIARVMSEVGAQHVLDAAAGPFTITARADRIDLRNDGGVVIYDYKTSGTAIRNAQLRKAPQLALEGLLAAKGAFPATGATVPADLVFILTAGGEPAGEASSLSGDTATQIETAEAGLRTLIDRFDREETAYRPQIRALFPDKARFDPYAHLARVKEWSAPGEEAE
jgi:ATP-dependent helicase/nuclease subunit B